MLKNRDYGVTSAQTSFRKCVFCDSNAVFFCYECKATFCQMCRANYHDKLPVSKDHSVKDLKSVNPSAVQLVCSEHKAEYTYYCVSCKTLVCSTCVTTVHTGHEMSEIKRKAEEIKKIAKSKLSNMKEKLQRLSKLVEKTKRVHIPNLDEESEDAIKSIRTIENDLHNIIKTKADIKTNEIEDKQNWTKEELQSTYYNNKRTFQKQTAVGESLQTLLSEEHAVSFLVSYQTLERDLYELTGEILEDTEPNGIKPPDLVAFLDEIVYSIEEYKKR